MEPSASVSPHPASAGVMPALVLRMRNSALDVPPPGDMLPLLDDVERERAGRTADSNLRASFIAGRYLLRVLAADVLGLDAGRLTSSFTCPRCSQADGTPDHGRPGYDLDGERLPLALSLSRSRPFILLGALDLRSSARRMGGDVELGVGVDLEAVGRVGFDGFDDVALNPAERVSLKRLPFEQKDEARSRLWARKEALVKALGTGFAHRNPNGVDGADSRITDLNHVDGVDLASEGFVAAVALVAARR